MVENEHFIAICKNAQCMKVNSLLVIPTESEVNEQSSNHQTESRSSIDSSASEVLISFWAFIVALLIVTL